MLPVFQLPRFEVCRGLPDASTNRPLYASAVAGHYVLASAVPVCLACPTVKSPPLMSRMLSRRLGRYRLENDGEHFRGRIWVRPQPHRALSMEDLVVLLLSDDSGGSGIRVIFRTGV